MLGQGFQKQDTKNHAVTKTSFLSKQQDGQTVLASSFETVALVCFADAEFSTGRDLANIMNQSPLTVTRQHG